jgi:hypothetical protein
MPRIYAVGSRAGRVVKARRRAVVEPMAKLNETQLVFLLGFLYGADCVRAELGEETKAACKRMETEHRRAIKETCERIEIEQRRELDEIIGRIKDNARTETQAIGAMFTAAINAVSDPDTLLKIHDAIHAEFVRLRGADSAQARRRLTTQIARGPASIPMPARGRAQGAEFFRPSPAGRL